MAVVASLTLITGVAVAPASQAAKIKLCLALDTGGVDYRSFNQGACAGAQASTVSNAESSSYIICRFRTKHQEVC